MARKAALQGKLIDGRYRGLGIGCYLEGGASGPKESARLVLEPDGTVSVYVGSSADRPGAGDGLRADRRRCAGGADARHQGRVPRLDRPRARRLRLLQLALDGDGRLRDRRWRRRSCALQSPPRRPRCSAAPPDDDRDRCRQGARHPADARCRSAASPGSSAEAPMPATSAPTATAPTPRMSRSIPRPARSSSSTTWRSRTSAASSTR